MFFAHSLAQIDIYYGEIAKNIVNAQPSYPIIQLFCDFGGALGLVLGSTFLTVAEVADFFVFTCYKRRLELRKAN